MPLPPSFGGIDPLFRRVHYAPPKSSSWVSSHNNNGAGGMQRLVKRCGRLGFAVLALSLPIAVAVAEAAEVKYTFSGALAEADEPIKFMYTLTGTEPVSGTFIYNGSIGPAIPFNCTECVATIGTSGVNELARAIGPQGEVLRPRPLLTGLVIQTEGVAGIGERVLYPLYLKVDMRRPFPEESLNSFLAPQTFRMVLDSDQRQIGITGTLTAQTADPLPPAW